MISDAQRVLMDEIGNSLQAFSDGTREKVYISVIFECHCGQSDCNNVNMANLKVVPCQSRN